MRSPRDWLRASCAIAAYYLRPQDGGVTTQVAHHHSGSLGACRYTWRKPGGLGCYRTYSGCGHKVECSGC